MRILAGTLLAAIAAIGYWPTAAQTAPPKPAGLIAGTVVDAEIGSPIAGVVVALASSQAGPRTPSLSRIVTDAQGRFFFDALAAGSYSLTTTKAGWIPGAFGARRPDAGPHPIALKEGERQRDFSILMWRYGVIAGRALDEQGDPLIGADVRIFQRSFAAGRAQWTFVTRAIADDRGAFRVASLLPGDYLVMVPATTKTEPAAMSLSQSPDVAYLQTMTSVGAAPMSLDRAETAARADDIRVTSILALPRAPSATGAWTTYATTLFRSATSVPQAGVVRVLAGRERAGVDIVVRFVPTFRVSGTLVGPDGAPAALHAVHLLPAENADHPIFDVATAVTDGAGRFTFVGVPAGEFVARVVKMPASTGPGARMSICGGTGAISFVCGVGSGPPPAAAPATPPVGEPLLYVDRPVSVEDRDVASLALTLRRGARVTGRTEFEGNAPRPTDSQWAALQVLLERADGQTFEPPGGFDPIERGRFSGDGRFATPSAWPGRYLLRLANLPPGWTLKAATSQGRDLSETAFDLTTDLDDVAFVLTDHAGKIDGTVQAAAAGSEPDSGALVLLFPTDPAAWTDYGRTSRRIRGVAAAGGKFSMPAPPEGEYFLLAIPDQQARDWQDPAFLQKLAAMAERIRIDEGQSITRTLPTKRIQ
jgi:protocatechuate 3,4-dioxygenase beta subunit